MYQEHGKSAIYMESCVKHTSLEPAYCQPGSMKDRTGKFICYNVLCATEIARTPGSTIIVHRARNHHPMCCCLCGSTAILMSRHITTKSVNLARHRCSKGTINPFDTKPLLAGPLLESTLQGLAKARVHPQPARCKLANQTCSSHTSPAECHASGVHPGICPGNHKHRAALLFTYSTFNWL